MHGNNSKSLLLQARNTFSKDSFVVACSVLDTYLQYFI